MKEPFEPALPSSAPRPARAESGMALVVLLVVALFVAVVGVAITDNVASELRAATSASDAVKARYLSEAGIADAANHLTIDNTWTGPITVTLGGGSYTVKLDTATSQTGPRGAVKSVVSTGSVFGAGPSGASQTVRETFLVLPQAFSKAALSNTTIATCAAATCDTGGYTPTIGNTVLRQLGAIHANNVATATAAVSLVAGTEAIGAITASQGGVTPTGICIACAPATNRAKIPFPTFNFSRYITLAQNNLSPCPGVQLTMFFTSQANFDSCVAAVPADAGGFRTLNGVIFVNIATTLTLPNTAQEQLLRINGTLIVWSTGPFGDLVFTSSRTHTIIITARNGEPAVMVGGSTSFSGTSAGAITVNGLFYVLAQTLTPTTTAPVCPGYNLPGTSTVPVTINGMLVGQNLGGASPCTSGGMSSNSLTYDPSSFFPGLPSGLVTPTNPFVLLPISWSSGK